MGRFRFLAWLLAMLATARSVQGATYAVSPDGNDRGTGAGSSPFKTISKAAAVAQAGDTVFVAAGVYRERVVPPRGGVTYRAQPGWKVFVKGSALWTPAWQSEGSGVYSAIPADALFDEIPEDFKDSHNPFRVRLSVSPHGILGGAETGGDQTLFFTLGQVFVNGEMYVEVGRRALLRSPKMWWYDPNANRVHVAFGSLAPARQQVEIAVRRRIFAPLKATGVDNITVEGFVFEHCGNNYPDRFQKPGFKHNFICGAVGIRNNNGWKIRDCVIRHAKTIGIDAVAISNTGDGPTGVLIERCYVVSNGQTGIFAQRTTRSVFRDNVIMYNNALGFTHSKPHTESTAGFKGLGGFGDNDIRGNYFAGNRSHGLWFDLNARNNTIARNVFVDNEEDAFYVELGGGDGFEKNFFVSNLVLGGNRQNSSLRYVDCGGGAFLHNLVIDHPAGGKENLAGFYAKTFNADRKEGQRDYTVGQFTFYNNLWIGADVPYAHPYPDHYSAPSRFDRNVYSGSHSARMFNIHGQCGSPWPYTDDQVAALVHRDLAGASPGVAALKSTGVVRMTLAEWRTFWQKHGTTGDTNGVLSPGAKASYDRATRTLTIDVDFDPAAIGSENHAHAKEDFLGAAIPQNGRAKPGPFQNLKRGRNTFVVWSGIPILADGQLP